MQTPSRNTQTSLRSQSGGNLIETWKVSTSDTQPCGNKFWSEDMHTSLEVIERVAKPPEQQPRDEVLWGRGLGSWCRKRLTWEKISRTGRRGWSQSFRTWIHKDYWLTGFEEQGREGTSRVILESGLERWVDGTTYGERKHGASGGFVLLKRCRLRIQQYIDTNFIPTGKNRILPKRLRSICQRKEEN